MNSATPNHREKEIFERALDLESGAERQAFVQGACGADAALCARVLALLAAHETDAGFLPDAPEAVTVALPVTEKPGDRIGRYKLLQQIGEGGCGVVYMAEQEEPVRRRVALKVIKLGMDTKSVIARFEAERQALALMDHPNIAKVLDAGATETGRPFFVMELIRGIKITDYCDQNNLPTKERLDLFIQVCHAIQHAHQKGIIHRDIKPSNILVSLHDGVPVPVVIDFGIAKATEQRLTDKTLFTAFEQFIGTPAYMSPEQAEMSRLDIDTRSDIYSLGVLLYELLTGQTPFDAKTLVAAGVEEMRRIIREQEPARPSTRLNTLQGEELTTTAKRRGTEAPKLLHLVRGDLDWIVMKCLEKDRTRRYETANGLAQDIQRHLKSEPVVACPPNAAYRVQKFVRRNRVMVGAASAVTLALVAGIIVSSWEAIRATRAEREESLQRRSTEQAKANEETQRRETEKQRDEARRQVLRFTVAKAVQLQTETNYYEALLWCAQAVRLVEGNADQEHLRRMHFASVLLRCPELVQIYTNPSTRLVHLTFSPDSRRLVTCGHAGARGWDVVSGAPLTDLLGTNRSLGVIQAAFSPDGGRILTTAWDGLGRIHDIATGDLVVTLPHRDPIQAKNPDGSGYTAGLGWLVTYGEFSRDGRRVVTSSFDHTAQVWDAMSGAKVLPPFVHDGAVSHAEFSPDGRRLTTVCAKDGVVRIWDATTGALVSRLPIKGGTQTAHFSPDGRYVVAANYEERKLSRIWDAATGEPAGIPLPLEEGLAEGALASFSPDGQNVLMGTSKDARMWNPWTGRLVFPPVAHTNSGENFGSLPQFSQDGRWFATGDSERTARVWNAKTGEPATPSFRVNRFLCSAAFSPDGCYLATGSWDASARVWDVTGSLLPRWPSPARQWINRVSRTFDGRRIAMICGTNSAQVLDAQSGDAVTPPLQHADRILDVQFSPDGQRVATASLDKTARIWDVATGQPITPSLPQEGLVANIIFSATGSRMATIGGDRIRVWDAITGQALTPSLSHSAPVECVAFSADGARIVSGSSDKSARLWSMATGDALTPPMKHAATVTDAAFSPDGRLIVTGSFDGTARVWDAATGEPGMVPIQHKFAVRRVAFSSDSQRILTVTEDGAWTWDLPTSDLPAEDLLSMASVVAGGEIDASGGFVEGSPTKARSDWMDLRSRYPQSRLFPRRRSLDPTRADLSAPQVRQFLGRLPVVTRAQYDVDTRQNTIQVPIDLTRYYNHPLTEQILGNSGGDYSTVPQGRQKFHGLEFDVRGLVRVWGGCSTAYYKTFPEKVTGIPVNRKCRHLHFLQSGSAHVYSLSGYYLVHYANGREWLISVIPGRETQTWWPNASVNAEASRAIVAWSGKSPQGGDIQLDLLSWENPFPETMVDTIDVVTERDWADTYLMAITVE